MKKFKHFALLLLAAVLVFGCSKYDDTELRNDVSDLQSRVEKLESWCTTTNTQISALQGLVTALEGNDYVTGVTPIIEGTKEVGYTITFTKSKPITILHGKDGVNGKDGVSPIIGVAKDTDEHYYWTVKIGDAAAVWMTDASGNKIRTTGDKGDQGDTGADGQPGLSGADGADGHSPVLSVAEFEGRLYWKIDGEWLLNDGNKVPATGDKGDKGDTGATGSVGATGSAGATGAQGPQGDAVFKKDGVTSYPDKGYVEFELANGNKIQLPLFVAAISFDAYTPLKITATGTETTVKVTLPTTLKKTDFAAIKADITNVIGTNSAITRATTEKWTVALTAPTFKQDGTLNAQPTVKVTVPATATVDETALLEVTVVDTKGNKSTSTRVLYFNNQVGVTGITFDKTTLTVKTGKTEKITAVVAPNNATNKKVNWTTSDAMIATVAIDGTVTGVKAGTATITATTEDGSFTATCAVTVENIAVTGITLADATISLGDKKTLTATIVPVDATIKTVTWRSSNTGIATINATTGEVATVAKGETTITATSTSNPTVTTTCKVKVEEKPSITWATGNLVADGKNGAKIGTATDGGLYFQFGSLIGWSTIGDDPTVVINPIGYTGSTSWNEDWTGDPVTDNAVTGTGDPCRYYLKGTWRLPTKDEYGALFNNVTNNSYVNSGGWSWTASPASATNSMKNLTFLASGFRNNYDGSLDSVGTYGYYWSSSPNDARFGYRLFFSSSYLDPSFKGNRASGLLIRCVRASN